MVVGFLVVFFRKGNHQHKLLGNMFYFSMLYASVSSLIIAILPGHKSPFLFSIGVFTCYLLVGGQRSLKYRSEGVNLTTDYIVSALMMVAGLGMVLLPYVIYGRINLVLLVFGTLGCFLSYRDFYLFQRREKLQTQWLQLHIIKIMGSFIASVSAFMVVNQSLPGIWNWFSAGLVGGFYIMYWLKKLDRKKKKFQFA